MDGYFIYKIKFILYIYYCKTFNSKSYHKFLLHARFVSDFFRLSCECVCVITVKYT